ncbi:MAG: hypothetical protein ABI980_12905 [Nitrospirota bacterium]
MTTDPSSWSDERFRVMLVLSLGGPHYSTHQLRKTIGTVGVSEAGIIRSRAMGLPISPFRDPAFMINCDFRLVSEKLADAADRD